MISDSQPIVRTCLDNGLKVFLKEVHTAPTASCSIWYRVGSRNEIAGLTGISHWVEHMQFKGTPTYPAGVPDRLIARSGGTWNASTWLDWTLYEASMPAVRIDLPLRLEADRMIHSVFDPGVVESERTVIISERQGNENSPSFRLLEAVQSLAFKVHPYRNAVIGQMNDLERITRSDLVNHYRRYYVPSNAVLTVAGHFKAAEMLELITELYGEIPDQPLLTDSIPSEPPIDGERRIVVDGPGETELLYVAYRAPSGDHPDFLPLAVLNSILAGAVSLILVGGSLSNQTSRLYRALVEGDLAATLGATLSVTSDPYLYQLGMAVRSDRSTEALLSAFDDEMAKLLDNPITQDELDKAIKQAQALLAYGNETSYRLAFGMGYGAIFPENRWLQNPLEHLAQVTVDQVMHAARKYLTVSNRIVGMYKPNGVRH